MTTLQVFDPPICCTTGECGGQNGRTLEQFASDLQRLRTRGVTVERHDAARGGEEGEDEETARVASRFLHEFGEEALPLFVVDGNVMHHGTYPSRGLLTDLVGLEPAPEDDAGVSLPVVEPAGAAPGDTTTRAAQREAWAVASEEGTMSRRSVLSKFASGIFAGLVAPAVLGETLEAQSAPDLSALDDLPDLPEPEEDEDLLIRMMRDLRRALEKPVEERRWGMVIDLRKCVGCHACTVACNAENHLPPGVVYRPVIEEEVGTFPNVSQRFIPRPCMQCENPPCTPVCPVDATFMRPDGIVEIDYDRCIGCRYCLTACPYNARTFDFGEYYTKDEGMLGLMPYEEKPSYEYEEHRTREHESSPVGNARKCHFCLHRIERGMLPQCVTSCIGRATYFGDLNDPDAIVSELAARPNATRLKEELGTEPKVFYLQ